MDHPAETDSTMCAVIRREDAREKGLEHFYTGKPCKRHHLSPRKVSNGACVACATAYAAAYYRKRMQDNPEGVRAQVNAAVKRHYDANRQAILDRKRAYYEANAETIKAAARQRRANRTKERQEQPHAASA
ncbi:hypothetical protein [Cupriavidus sp. Marseille-Q8015]